MPSLAMSDLGDDYRRIFGTPEPGNVGRTRLCKVCGGWHRMSAWPHNCRREAPPRANLAAPMLAPRFDAFVAGSHDAPVVINDRRDKREYMEVRDLVEFDEGVAPEPEPTAREQIGDIVADMKRVMETDPLNLPPVQRIDQLPADDAGTIDTTDMEIVR